MHKASKLLNGVICSLFCIAVSAQTPFSFKGQQLTTSSHVFYVNPAQKSKPKAFTFASVKEALAAASENNDSTEWLNIYIEPSVYWLDNPDDDAVRRPKEGSSVPYAMELQMSKVRMIGMCDDAQDVVFACNRGQTQGAEGNYTMLHIVGSDIEAENITFGNYCNVDLVYPKDPRMNRAKRKDAIVQAQIAICKGDRYRISNCRFISRLNLCPFVGPSSVDFENCYFECTDDALCGTGIYRKCRFTFYSSKPFYTTVNQGAKFYDCDIYSKTSGVQYLTKVSGPVIMENCRWTSDDPNLKIEWAKRADPRHFCKMSGCTLNGKPLEVPTPTEPLPVVLPAMDVKVQKEIIPGRWTVDAHKPIDTRQYSWSVTNTVTSWAYAEGVDGAEGSFGLVPVQRGARLMYTPQDEFAEVTRQECVVYIDPCKSAGQGFGSATGQYLDICIKFDTRSLSGYGIRIMRSPDYDHSVVAYLVQYSDGNVFRLSERQRCDLFKSTCAVKLKADGKQLTATISHNGESQDFSTEMPTPNTFGGFHLQHTGTLGASAIVVKGIKLK